MVGIACSEMGTILCAISRRWQRLFVTSECFVPAASCRVRSRCVARSLSPRANQSGPPSFLIEFITFHVSSSMPQPVSGFANPASVYITVSKSGQMRSPRWVKSSPTLTAIIRSSGCRTIDSPCAIRAPPTPPASARQTILVKKVLLT